MSNSRLAGHSTIHFDADLYQAMVLKSAESGESLPISSIAPCVI